MDLELEEGGLRVSEVMEGDRVEILQREWNVVYTVTNKKVNRVNQRWAGPERSKAKTANVAGFFSFLRLPPPLSLFFYRWSAAT